MNTIVDAPTKTDPKTQTATCEATGDSEQPNLGIWLFAVAQRGSLGTKISTSIESVQSVPYRLSGVPIMMRSLPVLGGGRRSAFVLETRATPPPLRAHFFISIEYWGYMFSGVFNDIRLDERIGVIDGDIRQRLEF
jgi:hypothetical protein